jgi:hypothetical protein
MEFPKTLGPAGADYPAQEKRHRAATPLVLIAVALVLGVILVWTLVVPLVASGGRAAPSAFSVSNPTALAPGAVGCRSESGDACFGVIMVSNFQGLTSSSLSFALYSLERHNGTLNTGPPVPVAINATVALVFTPGHIESEWNWSDQSWFLGAAWTIPTGTNVSVVFDSGLRNVSLAGDLFQVNVTSPGRGSSATVL